jgi:hypothetical protein
VPPVSQRWPRTWSSGTSTQYFSPANATLQRWLTSLPGQPGGSRPRLSLARAFLALAAGDMDAAEQAITTLGADLAGADDSFRPSVGAAASLIANVPAAAAIARAWLAYLRGDADDVAGFAAQARARLRDGDWLLESICRVNLALADWLGGRLSDAEQHITACQPRRAGGCLEAKWHTRGVIEIWSDGFAAAPAMRRLADHSFQPDAFRRACDQIGVYDPTLSDASLWYFRRTDGTRLIVDVDVDSAPIVRDALLSMCWWQTHDRSDHGSDASHVAERREFDRAYSTALAAAETVAGPPLLSGRDNDQHAHRWALWRGRTGLFIVQRSTYDLQFGTDVNFWVRPWTIALPRPTTPFLSWLIDPSPPPRRLDLRPTA